jgi:hypothetical protein
LLERSRGQIGGLGGFAQLLSVKKCSDWVASEVSHSVGDVSWQALVERTNIVVALSLCFDHRNSGAK